jgi:hypothetical protein
MDHNITGFVYPLSKQDQSIGAIQLRHFNGIFISVTCPIEFAGEVIYRQGYPGPESIRMNPEERGGMEGGRDGGRRYGEG